ncbi:MAG TPA: peptidoglycan-binding domain-containing protein [Anaeromyxobacteraceae bacterium]|nr:peptidoglycan-binding domain-containing protein [Anaeromyxobacteraceae bacterium]
MRCGIDRSQDAGTMRRILFMCALVLLTGCATSEGKQLARPADRSRIESSQLSASQVRLVQRSLADHGFAVSLTDSFDDATERALADFQRARGLPPSAALDRLTIAALGLDPRDVTPEQGPPNADVGETHASDGG